MAGPGRRRSLAPPRAAADERGEVTALAVTSLAVLTLVVVVFQAAVWFLGRNVAAAAAQEGARAARVDGASAGDGAERARAVATRLGARALADLRVEATRDPERTVVVVEGRAPRLLPGIDPPLVRVVVESPTEGFRRPS